MSKQKVLYITLNSFMWGDNRALLNILDGARDANFSPMVVVGSHGNFCFELEKRQIPYQIVRSFFSVYPPLKTSKDLCMFLPRLTRIVFYNWLAKKRIIKIAKSFAPELIHSNVGPVHVGYRVARILKIPHVWHLREYQDLNLKMTPLYTKRGFIRKINSPSNNTIAISRGVDNHYHLNNNSKVIYDGVLSRSSIRFESKKENYFLFTGRLDEGKGVHNLIDAFIEFCEFNKQLKLLIAGKGSPGYEEVLRKKVTNSKLEDRIVFLGFREDVFSLMERALALIVPSYFEGFGFITAEAMFNGCLVIGNNTGGTKEILEKEQLGILYSGHDELVSAMKQVVSNGIEYYYPMIQKAQKRATELYSTEKNAEEVLSFYKQILKRES